MSNWVYNLIVYYVDKGGIINLLIFAVCTIIIYIASGRWWYYRKIKRSISQITHLERALTDQSRMATLPQWMRVAFNDWFSLGEPCRSQKRTFVNRYREMLLREVPKLDAHMDMMGALVTIAPLLGLLGTVVGMVKTFSTITTYGIGNPNLLSEGISVSLITTQTGLLVSFPGLLLHNWLCGKKEQIVSSLIQIGETVNGDLHV